MSKRALEFLSSIPLFSMLPLKDREQLAQAITEEKYPQGTVLSRQGKSKIEKILLVKSGALELYYNARNRKILSGLLRRGDVFGGISLLMNEGIAVRTAQVDRDAAFYVLPKHVFKKVCARHRFFYDHFVETFSKRMLDESYASIIASAQAITFLSHILPFSFLSEKELEQLADDAAIVLHPKNTVLFLQGRSTIDHLYIIQKGAAERYYEEQDKKTLRGLLGEGDIYGGISMLLNESIAVRSLKTTEATYFYTISKKRFLETCRQHEAFSDFFTDTFGKRMLDRSYAEIIAQSNRPRLDSPHFFNQAIEPLCQKEIVFCDATTTIQAAAEIMSRHRCSSIFIRNNRNDYIGLVTDNDFRTKVIAKGQDTAAPVASIMSAPLNTISGRAFVFEAMLTMSQKRIKHLAIENSDGKVVGVLTNHDLLTAQGQSPFFIINEIAAARTIDEIAEQHRRLPRLIQTLMNSGAKAQNVTRLITTLSDTVLEKIIAWTLDEIGPPPVPFVFMILGSEGRKEQTLKTDQDNAIVYLDVPEGPDKAIDAEAARDYFLELGEKVCDRLDHVGYAFCEGDIMAKNPRWCQPLSIWKQYFAGWIHAPEPEHLLRASIFFDFRCAYGDKNLMETLNAYLNRQLGSWTGFFRHLTENALHFKPPIGFFRNFLVESKGQHRNAFDIKSAMLPIVDFARIYALRHRVAETNTLSRLHQLYLRDIFTWQEYNELQHAYVFLMQLRFARQVTAIVDEQTAPNNYVNPKKLSRIEQTMLKEIFKRIEKFQQKLDFDFTGLT